MHSAGQYGPDTTNYCDKVYKGNLKELHDPDGMYETVYNGIQTIKIGKTGYYQIDTYGAQGGFARTSTSYRGGYGAHVQGTFKFEAGTMLHVVVGQSGSYCYQTSTNCDSSTGGAGGGGTFVWMGTKDIKATKTTDARGSNPPKLLLVAGGGGGGSYGSTSADYNGMDAEPWTGGGHMTRGDHGYQGGNNGNGGWGAWHSSGDGGGGGGWVGTARGHRDSGKWGQGGFSGDMRSGSFRGGSGYYSSHKEGGFGCGGGTRYEGGGGGGYSGGAGGRHSYGGGGFGGSYKVSERNKSQCDLSAM